MKPRRVLIVTSSWEPVVIADMQRTRMLAWDLPAAGWEVEVLAPDDQLQRQQAIDPGSHRFFAPNISVHLVSADEGMFFKALRITGIGWRAFRPLFRKGLQLLRAQRFDLVYISTAQFNLFCLGRLWLRKTAVPYVLDFHDPWVRTENRYRTTRSSWKRRVDRALSRFLESFAIRKALGIVSVSPIYLEQLQSRYPKAPALQKGRTMVAPFGAMERDFSHSSVTKNSVPRKIVYVGAGGSIMSKSFARICELISSLDRKFVDNVQIELYGTRSDWTPLMPKELELIAKTYGLEKIVSEQPGYIPYSAAIQKIRAADGLLILGVDDPAYMPSKLFLYSLSGKPLLASLHAQSHVIEYFQSLSGLGHIIHFECPDAQLKELETTRLFIEEVVQRRSFDRHSLLARRLSPSAAREHAEFFERLVTG